MRTALFLSLVTLAGCAADSQGFLWSDRTAAAPAHVAGNPVWVVSCEDDIVNCYERARVECAGDYDVVSEEKLGYGSGRTKRPSLKFKLTASCR